MERKLYKTMLEWKQQDAGSTALLIDGARRVGKSYIAEAFGRREYRAFVLIDFGKVGKNVKSLFEDYLDNLDLFFMYLQEVLKVKLPRNESLIVFDEVQKFPRAREAIKHLVADGRYHYIETGSLISLRDNVKDILIPSEERHLEMHPMDFEEFLMATGNEMTIPVIRDCFDKRRPLGKAAHAHAMSLFRQYVVVGGMPQAVKIFAETADLSAVDRRKRDILKLYASDIRKYGGRLVSKIETLFDDIPAQLTRHERRFRLSLLEPGAKMRNWEDVFTWLSNAMLINVCYNSTEPNLGLKINRDRTTLKCYMADTGLLVSHSFDESELAAQEIHRHLLLDNLDVNNGIFAENVVAQMLRASGHKLYFYSKYSHGDAADRMEIDFLTAASRIERRNNVSPVEVKSGKRFRTSSLIKFCSKYGNFVRTPYVLYPGDVRECNGVVFLPLYMAHCL